ncbi:hypothetical protein SS50377_23582 [Spironucleus salmonicida]|uniref:Uncharacterized protein n=1 Tax=Spironucleus salmonicida TaxID=348837 RepID=V6LVE3_9EUKA|nr:hypothetical protein SS50377_23582 [Spironucleus salmonicida]|eukprot:EST48565.1 Hypothetical protein SS50377_11176 [Spironucleus salmonicida]
MDKQQKILTGLLVSLGLGLIISLTWTFIIYSRLMAETVIFNNLIVKNGFEANFAPSLKLRAPQGLTGSSLQANIGSGELLNSTNAILPTPPIINKFTYTTATADVLNIQNISTQSTIVSQTTTFEVFNQQGIIPQLTSSNLKTSKTISQQAASASATFTQSSIVNNLNSQQTTISSGQFQSFTSNSLVSTQLTAVQQTKVTQTYTNTGNTFISGLTITNSVMNALTGSDIRFPSEISANSPLNINFTQLVFSTVQMAQSLDLLNNTNVAAVEIAGTATVNSSVFSGLTINKLTLNELKTDILTVTGASIINNLTCQSFNSIAVTIGNTGRIDNTVCILPRIIQQGVNNAVLSLTNGEIRSTQQLEIKAQQMTVNGAFKAQSLNIKKLLSSTSITANQQCLIGNVTTTGDLTTTSLTAQRVLISGELNVDTSLFATSFGNSANQNYIVEQSINIIASTFTGISIQGQSVNSQSTVYVLASLQQSQCRFQ